MKWVKTQLAGCLSGVKYRRTKQMPIVAETGESEVCMCLIQWLGNILFIGANQKMIRCKVFVVKELITPRMHRRTIDKMTVSSADLNSG